MKRRIVTLVLCGLLSEVTLAAPPVSGEDRQPVTARQSGELGATVACDRLSIRREFRAIAIVQPAQAAEVLALNPSFRGHVVRIIRGDLATQAELLLSRPDAEDVSVSVLRTEGVLMLTRTSICSWVYTNSRGDRAATDVAIQSRVTRDTTRIAAGIELSCASSTRVEVRYEPKRVLIHFGDARIADADLAPGSTPAICPGNYVELSVKLPQRMGNRKLVVLTYFDAT